MSGPESAHWGVGTPHTPLQEHPPSHSPSSSPISFQTGACPGLMYQPIHSTDDKLVNPKSSRFRHHWGLRQDWISRFSRHISTNHRRSFRVAAWGEIGEKSSLSSFPRFKFSLHTLLLTRSLVISAAFRNLGRTWWDGGMGGVAHASVAPLWVACNCKLQSDRERTVSIEI